MDIYDKIKEIKELAMATSGDDSRDDELNLSRIINICEQILINHQTQQALKRLENEPKRLHP